MAKFKVKAKIEVDLPVSKKMVKTNSYYIDFYVEADNEYEAEQMLQDRIQFDYKFGISRCDE